MRKSLLLILTIGSATMFAQTGNLPANPEPGKCYVKCVTHDEFQTETVKIQTAPEYKTISIVPGTFKWVEEKVLIKEAAKKFIYHPATYEWQTVSYTKRTDIGTLAVEKAQLTNSSETTETFPKTANWEYTTYSECTSPNPQDCQTLCYVEKPAQFKTTPTKVLASDARTVAGNKPGNEATYKKQVITKAAWVEEIEIPAVYSTIKKQVVDVPAREVAKIIPAQYTTVSKEVLTKKGNVSSWTEIDCGLVTANDLNIIWNSGSSVLRADAKAQIDAALLPLLNEKPGISVELSSHTDSQGSAAFNRALSQKRADAVKSYLVSKGINGNRVISKGYGESKLVNNCSDGVACGASQHQANRRTEYKVISGQ